MIVIHGALRGAEFIACVALRVAGSPAIKTTPTLAAGDVKVSKDFGTLANLATLPAETPAASGQVKVTISATEMDAACVVVRFIDAAGAEWDDEVLVIYTTPVEVSQLSADKVWASAVRTLTAGAIDLVLVDGVSLPVALSRLQAVVCGVCTGAGSGEEKFYHPDGVTERVIVTCDSSGNRSSISFP